MLDINTLAAWGEFIGGIAVVVLLIYLAGQIRQNSRLLRASTASLTMEAQNSMSGRIVDDPEVARIWWAGCEDRSSLSALDLQRYDAMMSIVFSAWDQEYDFSQDKVMSERVWKRRRHSIVDTMRQPGVQQWWRAWAPRQYETEFREYIDGLIREGAAAE
jgi:hypothetical protein